jgi:4-amino-4-deoxy-L-arabinose transferase-like glycosyltransferase
MTSALKPLPAASAATRTGFLLGAAAVICSAVAAAWLHPGFIANDDYTYLAHAARFAEGDLAAAPTIVGRRYGFTFAIAAPIRLFGVGSFAVLLPPLFFAAAETALVAFLAFRIWGPEAGVYSAVLFGFAPLRLYAGGVAMPDSEVALFITLSFVCFFLGERHGGKRWYAAGGVAAGAVFWAKEKAIVFLLAYAVFPLVSRRLKREWGWFAAGAALMIAIAAIWFGLLSGDPLYLPRSLAANVRDRYMGPVNQFDTAPQWYLPLLFGAIHYYGLLPWAAAAGLFLCRRRRPADGWWYPAAWALALLCVFSLTVTSLAPFRFIAKQHNYSLYFVAPFGVFAGFALSRLPRRAAIVIAAAAALLGIGVAALRREANRLFLANSWAAADFARRHPGATVFGSVVNTKLSRYASWTRPGFAGQRVSMLAGPLPAGSYAVVDRRTLPSGFTVPSCWEEVERLVPQSEGPVAPFYRWAGRRLAGAGPAFWTRSLERLAPPAPATVYRAPYACP